MSGKMARTRPFFGHKNAGNTRRKMLSFDFWAGIDQSPMMRLANADPASLAFSRSFGQRSA